MAAWITPADVHTVYGEIVTVDQIAHVQGLAEVEIGPDVEIVTAALRSVMVEIMHRFVQSLDNGNVKTEQLGPHSTTYASTSGFGLTNREINTIKAATGRHHPLWIQPTTRDHPQPTATPGLTTYPPGVFPASALSAAR